MPLYEHVFLARQDVSQTQVEALTKEYTDLITELQGTVSKTEYWGLRSLAYKIKKNRKAHYTLLNIDAPSAAVAEMERRMGISTDVLRFLTIRVDEHEAEQSIQMRKSDRDERGGFGRDRGGFRGDRGPRPDRPRGDRPPREGGFRSGPREGGFGDRPPREGGFGDRAPREGGFGDRGPRGPQTERT